MAWSRSLLSCWSFCCLLVDCDVGTLIELAIGAAIVGALAFGAHKAWDGFTGQYVAQGKQQQIAHDQPIIDAANANAAEDKKRAENAQADTKSCQEAAATQSKGVNEWHAKAVAAQARVKALESAGAKQSQDRQAEVQRLQLIATAKDVKAQTCEEKLGATDKLLRDAAKARTATKAVPK